MPEVSLKGRERRVEAHEGNPIFVSGTDSCGLYSESLRLSHLNV